MAKEIYLRKRIHKYIPWRKKQLNLLFTAFPLPLSFLQWFPIFFFQLFIKPLIFSACNNCECSQFRFLIIRTSLYRKYYNTQTMPAYKIDITLQLSFDNSWRKLAIASPPQLSPLFYFTVNWRYACQRYKL